MESNPGPSPIAKPPPPPLRTPRAAWRIWLARGIAVAADVVQLATIPAGSPAGAFSPLVDGIDIIVAILLTLLVGWHIAFIPSFLIKLLPFADLAPTWTIAIGIATWPKKSPPPAK